MATWIDFRKLRQEVTMSELLTHYGIGTKRKGRQVVAKCPLPSCGDGNALTFSANLEKGVWRCFRCNRSGNPLDLFAWMEGVDPKHTKGFRQAMLRLQEQLGKESHERTPQRASAFTTRSGSERRRSIINPPLDFELKGLNSSHESLKALNLSDETIRYFGLGYCSRGYFKGRVAIPLHSFDPATNESALVGYAGRLPDPSEVIGDNPLYLFPETRKREGVTIEFRKDLLVYNAHRVWKVTDAPRLSQVTIVRDVAAVWTLWERRRESAVAVIGEECSSAQLAIIRAIMLQLAV